MISYEEKQSCIIHSNRIGRFGNHFFGDLYKSTNNSFFVNCNTLFTIAQTIESKENYMDEDMQNAFDVANKVGNFNYNDEMMMFFKTWMKYDASNTKKKWMERTVIVINCVAFIVLFVGFAIPIQIPSQLSAAVSILSTALLFLSIWFVDKQQQRKEQWNEVLMLSLIGKNANQNPIQVEEAENGQTENGNP